MKLQVERYLPIGSIVLLKEAKKKIMIVGFCMKTEKDGKEIYFDYMGCLWPEGIIDSNQQILFNVEDIDKVIHEGYSNINSEEYKNKLKEVVRILKEKNSKNNEEVL